MGLCDRRSHSVTEPIYSLGTIPIASYIQRKVHVPRGPETSTTVSNRRLEPATALCRLPVHPAPPFQAEGEQQPGQEEKTGEGSAKDGNAGSRGGSQKGSRRGSRTNSRRPSRKMSRQGSKSNLALKRSNSKPDVSLDDAEAAKKVGFTYF